MANFCFNHQRYQSFATERTSILSVFLENQIALLLVAMVVIYAIASAWGRRPERLEKSQVMTAASILSAANWFSLMAAKSLLFPA
jgi:Co/Zn/Cd efflux system component